MNVMHVLQMQMLNTFQGLINMGHNQNNYFTYIYIHARCQHRTPNLKKTLSNWPSFITCSWPHIQSVYVVSVTNINNGLDHFYYISRDTKSSVLWYMSTTFYKSVLWKYHL